MSEWSRAYFDDVDNMEARRAASPDNDLVVEFSNDPRAREEEFARNRGQFWTVIGRMPRSRASPGDSSPRFDRL